MNDHDDGYDGPAQLIAGGSGAETVLDVDVSLRGHFDPISGSYRWYGRVTACAALTELIASVPGTVVLRTPHGQASTTLSDVDPWGRPRVEGFGPTPFIVVSSLDANSGSAE